MTKEEKAKYDKDRRDRIRREKVAAASAETNRQFGTALKNLADAPPEAEKAVATPAAVPSSTIQRVMENSVIWILKFSRLQTKRSLGTEVIEVESDKSMIHVAKDILDSEELRAVVSYDNSTAMWFRSRCTYAPWVRGFLMGAQLVPDAFAWMDARGEGRAVLIQKFKAAYPAKIADAKARLRDNFDETEYPPVEAVERAFTMEYMPIDFAVSKKLTSVVSKAAFDRESQKLQASMATAAQTLDQTLAFILQETVDHLVGRLTAADAEGKPKRLHASALAKLDEFVAIFPKRNLTGNEELAELVARAKRVTSGVDVKQLKNVADTRVAVVTELTSVKQALDKMLVDAPNRRMTLNDEEV
jgi:hypothetical protein